jgi:hypothetical protein
VVEHDLSSDHDEVEAEGYDAGRSKVAVSITRAGSRTTRSPSAPGRMTPRSGRVDAAAGRCGGEVSERDDPISADPDVRPDARRACSVDDLAALQDEIEGLRATASRRTVAEEQANTEGE